MNRNSKQEKCNNNWNSLTVQHSTLAFSKHPFEQKLNSSRRLQVNKEIDRMMTGKTTEMNFCKSTDQMSGDYINLQQRKTREGRVGYNVLDL